MLFYNIFDIINFYQNENSKTRTTEFMIFLYQVDRLKVMFIFCTYFADLYKWELFIIATKDKNKRDARKFIRDKKRLEIITAILLFMIVAISLTLIGFRIGLPNWEHIKVIKDAQVYFIITIFSLFLIGYAFMLVILRKQMKKAYPNFYEREKDKIYLATISIVVCIAARVGFNIATLSISVQDALGESMLNNTWFWPVYSFTLDLFTSVLPLTSTVYSLMYMFSHKKNIM
jgi:hypothetical protein